MRTDQVRCIACGSRLDIPTDVRYIACHVCGVSLSLQHRDEGILTAIVGASPALGMPLRFGGDRNARAADDGRTANGPDDGTAQRIHDLERRLDDLERENALLRLERAWEEERDQYLIRTRNGARIVPTVKRTTTGLVVVSIIGGLMILAGFALAFTVVTSTGRVGPVRILRLVSGLFVPIGFLLIMVAMVGVSCYLNRKKAFAFLKAHAQYQAERARLLGYDSRGPRRDE